MQLDLTFSLHCGNDNNDIICDIQEQVKLLLTYYRGNEFNIEWNGLFLLACSLVFTHFVLLAIHNGWIAPVIVQV